MNPQVYRYRAARRDGRLVGGEIEGASLIDATSRLVERGLAPIGLEVQAAGQSRNRAASRRSLAIAFRSIATLLTASLPLERALAATEPLCEGALKAALSTARGRLAEGDGLAAALSASNGVVPALPLALVRAGEQAGRLNQALEQVATQLEWEADLLAKLRGALAYPALLAVGGTISVAVIALVVVPRFAILLADVGQELPPTTAILLAASAWMARWWLVLLVIGCVGAVAFIGWVRTAMGRTRWHRWLLSVPVVAQLRQALASSRFLQALGGALTAGMPLAPALRIATEAAADAEIGTRTQRATESVLQGQPLTSSLAAQHALSPLGLHLLAIGESGGQLAVMAQRAGELLAQEAERQLQSIVRLLEPLLIVVFGGLVALVAAALLQAVYSLRPAI